MDDRTHLPVGKYLACEIVRGERMPEGSQVMIGKGREVDCPTCRAYQLNKARGIKVPNPFK